jgi:hypothetical protein
MEILELIRQPWPWYIAGPLVGLTVPALLILGNKSWYMVLYDTLVRCVCQQAPFLHMIEKEIWNMFSY